MATFPATNWSKQDQNQMHEKHTINRDGLAPLRFTGTEIGSGTAKAGTGRSTTIRIYETQGDNYVAEITRETQWEGEEDHTSASSFGDFGSLIEWLREDGDSLGRASHEAVENAIRSRPFLRDHFIEEVE